MPDSKEDLIKSMKQVVNDNNWQLLNNLTTGTTTNTFVVGEKGPEAIVASTGGYITAHVSSIQPNVNGFYGIRGTLIIEGTPTGDGRKMEKNSLFWEEGPWSLMAVIENAGHDGAPIVGRIDTLTRVGDDIMFDGLLDAEYGSQAAELIEKQMLRGISADLDSAEVEFQKEDGSPITEDDSFEDWMNSVMVFTKARVRGGTILAMPAFVETQLEMYQLDSAVADAHVASAGNTNNLPPMWWFENPDLKEVTPLTVTKDGHVFGHIAPWNQCHIGISGTCAFAPRSNSDYASFTRGAVNTWCESCGREEEVAVGPITATTGHAKTSLTPSATVAHYDNSGSVVAQVAAGEDAHGIWVAGRIAPGAKQEQIDSLLSIGVSGDWRRINGALDLVAILSVPVPGYPIQRKTVAHVASGNVQTALVTAPFGGKTDEVEKLAGEIEKLKKVTVKMMANKVNNI